MTQIEIYCFMIFLQEKVVLYVASLLWIVVWFIPIRFFFRKALGK